MTPTINSKAGASTSPDKPGIQETGVKRPEGPLALTETRQQFRRVSEADPSSHINDPDNPPRDSSGLQLQSGQVASLQSLQIASGSHQTQQEAALIGVRGASTNPDKLGIQETGGIHPADALALTETRHQFRRVSEADPSSHINDPDNPPRASSGLQFQSRQVASLQSLQIASGSHQAQQEAAPIGVRGASTNPDKLGIQETGVKRPEGPLALTETRQQFRRVSEADPSSHINDPDNPPRDSSGLQLQSRQVTSSQMAPGSHQTQQEAAPTGVSLGKSTTQSSVGETPLMGLPNEMLCNIFKFLPPQDCIPLSQVNKRFKEVIKGTNVIEKKWFGQFPLSHQEQQKKIVTEKIVAEKDLTLLRNWLAQFSNDNELIESVLNKHKNKYFPAIFLFTISQLMHQCTTFKVDTKDFFDDVKDVCLATVSTDGRHIVIVNDDNKVTIASQGADGSWEKKTTYHPGDDVYSAILGTDGRHYHAVINDSDGTAKIAGENADGSWEVIASFTHGNSIKSATFSADGCHVVIISCNRGSFMAAIYGRSADGSWKEETTINPGGKVKSATFSADGCCVVTVSDDKTVKILGQNAGGSWEDKLVITHNGKVYSATFSTDGRHVVTTDWDGGVKITDQSADGSWKEKATFTHSRWAHKATFSADGRYVVTVSDDGTSKILGQNADGSWIEKLTITHDENIDSATFSTDGRHVVTTDWSGGVKITDLSVDGSWKEQDTFTHRGGVKSAIFSDNGRYVVTVGKDNTAKILGQNADGSWEEKLIITHRYGVNSATFSADGYHVVTASNDKTAKILGRIADGSWKEKATINPGGKVKSATFSADGRYVLTRSNHSRLLHSRLKITKLSSAAEDQLTHASPRCVII